MAREDILQLLLLLREKIHYFTIEYIIKYSFSVDAFFFFLIKLMKFLQLLGIDVGFCKVFFSAFIEMIMFYSHIFSVNVVNYID